MGLTPTPRRLAARGTHGSRLTLALIALVASTAACKDEPAGGAATMASAAAAKWAASASAPVPPPPPPEKPHPREVLAQLHQPKGLARSGAYLYVVDTVGGDKNKGTEVSDLVRVSTQSGDAEAPTTLATKQHALASPLIVKDAIYMTVAGDRRGEDRLVTMSLKGGPMKTLASHLVSLADPGIATDGTSLFYLAVSPPVGNAAAPAERPKMDVMRLPLAGGKALKLATVDHSARLLFVAADAHDVYFPEAGRIARVPVAGGEVTAVAKVVYAWAAVSDGTSLFFSDSPGDSMGTVRSAPVAAGAPKAATLASGFSFPVSLALSERDVFFVNFDAEDGALFRVPKQGGVAVPLLQGQKHPSHVVLDAGAVYWTNTSDGTVCRTSP